MAGYNPAEQAKNNATKSTEERVKEAKTGAKGVNSSLQNQGSKAQKINQSTALQTEKQIADFNRKVEKGTAQGKLGLAGSMLASGKHLVEDAVQANTGKKIGSLAKSEKQYQDMKESGKTNLSDKSETKKTTYNTDGTVTTSTKEPPKTTTTPDTTSSGADGNKPPKSKVKTPWNEKMGKKYGISEERWNSMTDEEKMDILDSEALGKGQRALNFIKHLGGSLGNGFSAGFGAGQGHYNPEDFYSKTKQGVGEKARSKAAERAAEMRKLREIDEMSTRSSKDLITHSYQKKAENDPNPFTLLLNAAKGAAGSDNPAKDLGAGIKSFITNKSPFN